ncbi:branched-chain amino acid transport system substrate-binding protein [Bradyrhizobium sp. LM6.11]
MRLSTILGSSLLTSALALCLAAPAYAQSNDPIKIGVIAEVQSIAGAATPGGAQIAADEINAKGGILGRKIEIVTYDNKSSSADSVRAFQRAVSEDKVSAVIASYISEVVLALEPWAARLKMPLITPGAASNEITKAIHNDYEKNKYTFHGYLTSAAQAQLVCDAAKDLLVDKLKFKTAAIMSEDAAWTKPLDVGYEACLPKAGLKVVEHVRFSPDTTDFTPIFNNIEGKKPDVIVTGISHVGVQPTVQWKNQQVPIPMFGISAQALSPTFWKDTNGAADGVPSLAVATPDVAVTSKTKPFAARRSRPSSARRRPIPATPPMTRSTSSRRRSSARARPIPTRWSPSSKRPTTRARSAASNSTARTTSSPTASSPVPRPYPVWSSSGRTASRSWSGPRRSRRAS